MDLIGEQTLISGYCQVPNKRVYSLNYCNVELLALIRAKSLTLQLHCEYTRFLGTYLSSLRKLEIEILFT